ncbi:microtubule-binding protein MIP-T3-domain-containing protein, partial [Catenaria anguillulae PL171]
MADTAPTITALKPLIQRTPLTDKLLAKPPFRYLHDLVSELIAASGVGAGLFIGDETNAAAVKEKDQKIAWLTKIIKLTELASGTPIKAKPAKIIAGLEPEETNAWLQVLGAVCAKRIDTTQMVASLGGSLPSAAAPPADSLAPPGSELVGAPTAPPTPSQPADTETAPAPSAKPAAAAEPKPASKEVRPGSSAKSPTSKSTSSSSKDKDKDKDKTKNQAHLPADPHLALELLGPHPPRRSPPRKPQMPQTSTSTSSSKDKEKSSSRDKLSSKSSSSSKSKSQSNSTDQLAAPAPPKPADPPAAVLAAPSSAPEPIPSPAPPIATPADTNPVVLMAATAPGDASSGNIDDDTAAADASDANANAAGGSLGDLRPTTARKAPPRPKQSAPEMGLGLGTEGGLGAMAAGPGGASGLAGARPGTASVVNVVAESSSVSASSAAGLSVGGGSAPAAVDDADDMFVVQRDDTDLPVFGGGSAAVTGAQPLVATANAEPVNPNAPHGGLVRKLLESKRAAADDALVPGLPRPASGMRRATSGGDDSGASAGGKDLAEDLQARVQAVTRAAHPLGRTLDYLHEDMEAMSKELAQWRSESAKYRALLTKEREVTESKVRPLLDEMAKLDAAIVLEQERIAQAKARVLANEELVEKYVLGMVTRGSED